MRRTALWLSFAIGISSLTIVHSEEPPATNNTQRIDAGKIADLKAGIVFWKKNAYRCKALSPSFPSKNDNPPRKPTDPPLKAGQTDPESECDDGDMTLFNGLLCISGNDDGCDGVRRAQGPDGRWWRSPRRIGSSEAKTDDEQATFSTDQALGVMAYVIKTGDKDRFSRWVSWIVNKNPRCGASSCVPPGALRYCQDDRCTFKAIDCALLDQLARHLGEKPVCGAAQIISIPLPAEYQKRFNDLIGWVSKRTGVPLDKYNKDFESALQRYEQAVNKLQEQLKLLPFEPAEIAETIAMINTGIAGEGSPRHLAGVNVFLLKKLGFESPELLAASNELVAKDPENPFFRYVAEGKANSAQILDIILKKCPANGSSIDHRRFQWSWERPEAEHAWTDTMYWDCIFMAALWQQNLEVFSKVPFKYLVDDAVVSALQTAENAKKQVEDVLDALSDIISHPAKFLTNPADALATVATILANPPNIVLPKPIRAALGGDNSVLNNPSQIKGGSNSVVNNPGQLKGGSNSVVNNPGQVTGGKNSTVNKVLGGKNSVVRKLSPF